MPGEVTVRSSPIVVAALLGIVGLTVLSGCGGGSHSHVQLSITVKHYVFTTGKEPRAVSRRFDLRCGPVSGTLPLARAVCADIAAHRQAMLAPRHARSTCGGSPFMPTVEVSVKRGVSGGGFSGSPGCGWPGGTPLSIYYAASIGDARDLARAEPLLRCEDDPPLFAKPTPWTSVVACTHGLWTPAAESAIQRAETAVALANVAPTTLFPGDPGAMRCQIPAGGPVKRTLAGLCEVKLTGPPSRKLVRFAETWTVGGRHFTHRWIIRERTLLSQSGSPAPQLWK